MPTADYSDEVLNRAGSTSSRRGSLKERASTLFHTSSRSSKASKSDTSRDDSGALVPTGTTANGDALPVTTATPADVNIDEELNNRIAFFSTIQAIKEGKLPNNEQLDGIFQRIEDSDAFDKRHRLLSPEGKVVKADLKQVLADLRQMLMEMNGDEDLQEFVHHAKLAADTAKQQAAGADQAVKAATAEAVNPLTNLARLLLTSEDFRHYLFDLNKIFQEMMNGFEARDKAELQDPDVSLPDEKRRAFMDRLGKTLRAIASDPEYKNAFMYLLDRGKQAAHAGRSAGKGKRVTQDANMMAAQKDLKSFIEKFSGHDTLDAVLKTFSSLHDSTTGDAGYGLRTALNDGVAFVEDSLKDPTYPSSADYNRRGSDILQRVRRSLFDNHLDDGVKLKRDVGTLTSNIQNDELVKKLSDDVQRLVRDLAKDENDKPEFKTVLLNDFANVVLPAVMDQIRYIPIPRIEHSNEDFFLAVESVLLTSETFLPDAVDVKLKHAARVAFRPKPVSNLKHRLALNLQGIHAKIEDIPFYYRRKTGFPKFKDYGVADVTIGGRGINTLMKLDVDWSSPHRTIVPKKIKVLVDDFKLNVHHTDHDSMFSTLAPFLSNTIKKQLAQTLESQLKSALNDLDYYVTMVKTTYVQTPERVTGGDTLRITAGDNIAGRFLTASGIVPKKKTQKKKGGEEGEAANAQIDGGSTVDGMSAAANDTAAAGDQSDVGGGAAGDQSGVGSSAAGDESAVGGDATWSQTGQT
ncbi:hypothetical protein HDV00_000021 [Rhizophlyctis rosea]|nr:hypothetical protein HDV00_000021 [Rhizophlyctis rosea]